MSSVMAGTPPAPQPTQNLGHHPAVPEGTSVTLLVRHLPEAITHDTIARLFSHYGASSVRPCSSGRVKNCAFVGFKNEISASEAQRQLHGLRFFGKVLSVETATKVIENKHNREPATKQSSSMMHDASVKTGSSDYSSGGYSFASEAIAGKLGVDYPFPPHLEYAYPPPDGQILTNIVNALIAVPRFYTQVLHLMNKMNIPAPFRKALPTPPLPAPVPAPSQLQPPLPLPPQSVDNKMEHPPSNESETESSDEEVQGDARPKKKVKRQAIVGPAVDKDVKHDAVGLKQAALVPKEKPIIKKNIPVMQIRIAPKPIQTKSIDDAATKELEGPNLETSDIKPYATLEELNSGRLPPEEILSLPRFKNYTAGDPTSVLYIKNLAKDVVVDDFYFIFGSLFGSFDAAKSNLSVKLMQEGRMRGQAFVTFPTVELAHNALNVVNGYVFKGKPMVIQFGRTPAKAPN